MLFFPQKREQSMAVKVRDFTKMPVGFKRDAGTVQTCTHCGKLGLREEIEGKEYFTHTETIGVNEEGRPVFKWDTCPPALP
jgi:hypothetical protein